MSLKIGIPKDINKIKQQIKSVEYQIEKDITEKDIRIHKAALKSLN